jgi:hypothetical protein
MDEWNPLIPTAGSSRRADKQASDDRNAALFALLACLLLFGLLVI